MFSLLKRSCAWLLALALVALVVAVLCARPLLFIETSSKPKPAPVIVVLGGESGERTDRALELMRAGAAPKILISGAGSEQLAKTKLRAAKVSETRLLLETKSTSTRENALFTVALLREQKITNAILVTSWYHSRRALACFHHAAPEIHFQSAPLPPSVTGYGIPTAHDAGFACLEYFKMIYYAARWQILPWQTGP